MIKIIKKLILNISKKCDNDKKLISNISKKCDNDKKYNKKINYKKINYKNITTHWNVINSPKNKVDVNYINIPTTSKLTYKEVVLKNIKYNILNKNLDKEIRQTVLINKIKNYYKNKTYSNIDNFYIKSDTIDNSNNYCTIC